jgi:uncharacterized membrane protein YadS
MSEPSGAPESQVRTFIKRHGISIALVLIAAFCYAIGYRKGSILAIILGVVIEIFFWSRLLRRG